MPTASPLSFPQAWAQDWGAGLAPEPAVPMLCLHCATPHCPAHRHPQLPGSGWVRGSREAASHPAWGLAKKEEWPTGLPSWVFEPGDVLGKLPAGWEMRAEKLGERPASGGGWSVLRGLEKLE